MGVDFTACGEHRLELGSGCDPALFARHPDFGPAVEWTNELLRKFNPDFRDEEPAWELEFGLRRLRLPGAFDIHFGSRLFLVNHIARWHTFLTDPGARSVLRRATRAIAGVLGSSGVYYLPDDCFAPSVALNRFWDDGSLEDVRADLIGCCGPPSLELDVIYREDDDETMLETVYFYEALPAGIGSPHA